MNELISIIVPSWNQGKFLDSFIKSVLEQDYRPFELIIIDGASTDETVDVLKARSDMPELRWISEPDSGPADAVNKGLAMARGKVAGIQSVDDYYLPGALRLAAEEFSIDRGLGILYGDVRRISADGEVLSDIQRPPHDNAYCLALCMCIPQSSTFFRTKNAVELGGWRKEYFTCDWDLWLRMMFRCRVKKIDKIMSARRLYPEQRTAQRSQVLDSYLRMLDDARSLTRGSIRMWRAEMASRFFIRYLFDADSGRVMRLIWALAATLFFPRVWPYIPRKKSLIRLRLFR